MSPSRISKKKGNDRKLTQSNPTTHRLLRVASVLKEFPQESKETVRDLPPFDNGGNNKLVKLKSVFLRIYKIVFGRTSSFMTSDF